MSLLLLVALARSATAQTEPGDPHALRRRGDHAVKKAGWIVTGIGGGMIVSGVTLAAVLGVGEHQAAPFPGPALVAGGAVIGGFGLIVTGFGHALPNPRYDPYAHIGIDATTDGATVRFTTRW